MVAECVAIKSGLTEVVQTFEILRRELIVSGLVVRELIVSELIVAKLIVGGEIVTGINCVIVTKIMGSELVTVAAHRVTSNSVCVQAVRRKAMSAQRVATPSTPHVGRATVGSKSVKPTAAATVNPSKPATPAVKSAEPTTPALKSTEPATAVKATSTSTTTAAASSSGKCGDVRNDAQRAHSNAGRQNAYCFLLHDAFPSSKS